MLNSLRSLRTKAARLHGAMRKLFQAGSAGIAKLYHLTHHDEIEEEFKRHYDLAYPPTHYYSPLPDVTSLKKNFARWYKETEAPGIDWNLQGQIKLAEEIEQFVGEIETLPPFPFVTQGGYGPGYGEVEAHVLYLMLRYLKPSKCLEVGSGISTFYTLSALRANQEREGVRSSLACIEPYPNEKLRELVRAQNIKLRECQVQDVEFSVFQELAANDMLFIDTSHVSKKDSDVDFLYLEVLPRLQKGVVIHIHDMPFPMPAIPPQHPVFHTFLFWNEPALVQAFLMFNTAFRVMMCQSYLHHRAPEVLRKLVRIYNPQSHFPSSLWLRKVT